jgi:hypothetical protein
VGDDSTLIGSHQEAGGDAQRAPSDGEDAQRASPGDGAPVDGGPEHPEEMLPNVMREEDVNAETETATGDVGEVVGEAEKNVGSDQQVQHLSHFFVHISHFLFFLSQSFFTLPLHQVPRSSAGDTTDVMGEVMVEAEKYSAAEQ